MTIPKDGYLLRINAPEIRAALTGVLGQRPVDGFGEIRCFGARERLLLRGSYMCARAAEYATGGNHQITVGRQLEQMKAGASRIVRTAAVSPRDHSQLLRTHRRQVGRSIHHMPGERGNLLLHRRVGAGSRGVRTVVLSRSWRTDRCPIGPTGAGRRWLLGSDCLGAKQSASQDHDGYHTVCCANDH